MGIVIWRGSAGHTPPTSLTLVQSWIIPCALWDCALLTLLVLVFREVDFLIVGHLFRLIG